MSNELERDEQLPARPDSQTDTECMSWEDILTQLDIATTTQDETAWQTALECVNLQDPARILEGQRFQGQGQ